MYIKTPKKIKTDLMLAITIKIQKKRFHDRRTNGPLQNER